MANIYKRRLYIQEESVCIALSESLYELVDHKLLNKAIKQINKLPKPIPKITGFIKAVGAPLENTTDAKIQKTRDLVALTSETGIMQVHVAYEPGEKYGLGNSVGRVYATNSGVILLNDVRLKQVAGELVDAIYLVNLIIHELLHVYGIDHAAGLGTLVKNRPVMNAGKFAYVGLSFDDKAGLFENYFVPKRKRVEVTINSVESGSRVALINKQKNKLSQGKNLVNNTATFTHVPKGKYLVYINEQKASKTIAINKDKVLDL